jgi:glycosyltransferase involved in cell wall biosynthesis
MISVVTPALNAAHVIERNLSAMAKQQGDFEHIIQDGGSRDGTRAVVERFLGAYRVRFCEEPDNGIYDAVSKGMSKAKGSILAWLGADDYYTPWALSTVEAVFHRFPNIDWIIGIPALGFDNGRRVWVASLAPVYVRALIQRGWYSAGALGFLTQESMFWRRSLWDKVDGSSIIRRYQTAGDYHLWRAFAKYTPLRTVSSILAVFSLSEQQVSNKFIRRYLQEVNPSKPLDERTVSKLDIGPSATGKLFNRVVSILCNQTVLRPGFGF